MTQPPLSARERLSKLGDNIRADYVQNRRVMSFAEYLELASAAPRTQLRSAPQYLLDCFDHYGTEIVTYPWGEQRRYRLFDCPWDDGRDRLIGQEEVQGRLYRALANFVHEGRANKLVLLHGPNGSAKSTIIRCIGRALEHYSTLEAGALYRVNWIFPSQRVSRAGIGFSGGEAAGPDGGQDTYAYLSDELIDAKLSDELRDHPLFLIPEPERAALLTELLGPDADGASAGDDSDSDAFVLSDYLRFGRLSHKNRAIYEALLANYQGDYLKVLRHVQIERFYIQQRYRDGYVTVEPQLSVDASERQITADRSVSALPAALQSVSLFEYGGELVNANRGLIEYSDLLKRPLEAYKYLLTTVEQASVSLQNATLFLDLVLMGTSNEIHLNAFKEVAEFQSFRGRLELVRVPYLLDITQEEEIYKQKIREAAGQRHVAPHCAYVAALWAVLTRMRKPQSEHYEPNLAELVAHLKPLDKAELYAYGRAPDELDAAQAKILTRGLSEVWNESRPYPFYEGRSGASPREMLVVLLNAANSPHYRYVSPLAIIDEIAELIKQVSVYDFLKQDPAPGGFHDHTGFLEAVRERLTERIDNEVRVAMGLIEESEYERLFQRYMVHVLHWTKKEKLQNPTTGALEEPDQSLMREVESTLGIGDNSGEFRHDLISKVGAWSLDNPKARPDYAVIFADYVRRLEGHYFAQRTKILRRGIEDALALLTAERGDDDERGDAGLEPDALRQAKATVDNLCGRFGYREDSARDALSLLLRRRYSGAGERP
ncbi:MAG: serine protein kinase [Haliangiales bacterium]